MLDYQYQFKYFIRFKMKNIDNINLKSLEKYAFDQDSNRNKTDNLYMIPNVRK